MIEAAIECLLFAAGEPLTVKELASAAVCELIEAETALRSLQISLTERGSGLHILRIAGGWQMATRREHAEAVCRLVARGANKLSRAALETVAIVAYRQPISSPEIEAIRGVSSDGVVRTLLDRRLIVEAGRRPGPGRPMLYRTTADFLHYFGIAGIGDLPALDAMEPTATADIKSAGFGETWQSAVVEDTARMDGSRTLTEELEEFDGETDVETDAEIDLDSCGSETEESLR